MSKKYQGQFHITLENINNETVITKKTFGGLIKISPRMHLDSEKISAYFIVGLGGGYVEGENYIFKIDMKKDSRAIITTQASTKVYKCEKGDNINQETHIKLEDNSVLEYITDNVILYKDADYKQENTIYMDKDSTLIYTDGITSGWSADGLKFQYKKVQLKTNIYLENKLVLLDNLLVNPQEDDVSGLGYFEGYENFGTLIVIRKDITTDIVEKLRNILKELDLDIRWGISKIETDGFVLRVLGNLTQDITTAIDLCHNYIRKEFLGSKELSIRKY